MMFSFRKYHKKYMNKLSETELKKIYDMIKTYHEKYLAKHGVRLPKLELKGSYTKAALTLIYLAQDYPNTKTVSKDELTDFVNLYHPHSNDVQQARHLAAQDGWFILSGTRNDNSSQTVPAGSYKLITFEEAYPGFTAERRDEQFTGDYWENLKKKYDYRCACCGSQEGKRHRYWKNTTVTLQKGHMDPSKPLSDKNMIPQCGKCNQAYRNYWIFDQKGRVVGIANEKVVDTCNEKIQKEIYARLFKKYEGKNPDSL